MSARILLVSWLCISSVASAAEVRGRFSTLLSGREDPRLGDGVQVIPLYELAAMEVDAIDLPGTDTSRVVLQGWGRLQLGDDELKDHDADLALLFLDSRSGPLRLKLGRQHLAYGVGRMALVDGVDARVDTPLGLAAQGFFGFTVHPQLRHRSDNWQAGGRLSFNLARVGHTGEIGAAYLLRRQRGELRRSEIGFDALTLVGPTRWTALAVLSPTVEALVEARLAGTWRVNERWTMTVDAERTAPHLFLPLDSIFTVFADAPHDAFGGDLSWTPSPYWRLELEGHGLRLDNQNLGYRGTVRGITYREPSHRSLIGAEVSRLDEADNGYLRGRLYTSLQVLELLRVSADAYGYLYDEDVNGTGASLLCQLSVVYDLAPAMRLAGTVAGGVTPWSERQIEGMLRFAYGWDVDLAREVGP